MNASESVDVSFPSSTARLISDRSEGERLWDAALEGDFTEVKRLLRRGAPVDWRDDDDRTALHVAARDGHSEIVALLLRYDADPSSRDAAGLTPLDEAVVAALANTELARVRIVDLLLQAGADPDARNGEGRTPREHVERATSAPLYTKLSMSLATRDARAVRTS